MSHLNTSTSFSSPAPSNRKRYRSGKEEEASGDNEEEKDEKKNDSLKPTQEDGEYDQGIAKGILNKLRPLCKSMLKVTLTYEVYLLFSFFAHICMMIGVISS